MHKTLDPELQSTPHTPDRLSSAIEGCSGKFAVGLVALTNLNELSERFGGDGEQVLTEVFRQRIATLLRPDDQMIVIADDSVCIVLDNLIDNNHLTLATLKLERLFDVPTEAAGQSVTMRVRTGLVYAGRRTRLCKSPADLYQLAEDTCLSAIFNNAFSEIVSASEDTPLDQDWALNQRVQTAMENHHISFDYQPKMDLESGEVVGCEALIRWRDDGRIIPPDEYLAALNDDILWSLTIYGYRRILREIIDYEITVPVSYNIDPSSLTQPDFVEFIRRETNLWGVDPQQIMLEITESNELFDLDHSKSLLASIRSEGFKISLDDFGTEHSNMLRVRELPLDEIKLDRSLCGNVLHDDDARQISQTVIALANTLGIKSVAEGIEDAATLELLKSLDCTIGQGFYLSPPVNIEEFMRFCGPQST